MHPPQVLTSASVLTPSPADPAPPAREDPRDGGRAHPEQQGPTPTSTSLTEPHLHSSFCYMREHVHKSRRSGRGHLSGGNMPHRPPTPQHLGRCGESAGLLLLWDPRTRPRGQDPGSGGREGPCSSPIGELRAPLRVPSCEQSRDGAPEATRRPQYRSAPGSAHTHIYTPAPAQPVLSCR